MADHFQDPSVSRYESTRRQELLRTEQARWAADRAAKQEAARPKEPPPWTAVQHAFLSLPKGLLTGRVFLVGRLVHVGTMEHHLHAIDVAVTDPADEARIRRALPQYRFNFLRVPGVPREPSLEVTRGTHHSEAVRWGNDEETPSVHADSSLIDALSSEADREASIQSRRRAVKRASRARE
jgi:hypothetical protein